MTDQDFQAQRSRSPAYPYMSLRDAVQLLEGFYKKHRAGKIPLSLALKDMGYSITSGAGARVASTLVQYGLFDVEGTKDERKIWVSSLGKTIALENPSNPGERWRALREAALKPEMHAWVYQHFNINTSI